MTHFESMLMPFGKRVAGMHLTDAIDLNAGTSVEMLDDQTVLQTNVLYIGTPKMAGGLLNGTVHVEPSCFLIIASGSGQSFPMTENLALACTAEVHVSLAALFNQINSYMRTVFLPPVPASTSDNLSFLSCWSAVMDSSLTSNASIRKAISSFYPSLKSFVYVTSVHFDDANVPESAYDALTAQLQAVLPEAYIDRYRDGLVVLTSVQERTLLPPYDAELKHVLDEIMERYKASMITSSGFRHMDKLRTNFMLCERALIMARSIDLSDIGRVNTFDRMSMYAVIDLACQQFVRSFGNSDIIYLIHPSVVQVSRYDRAYGTSLRDTLFYYLLHSRNLARTAAATFMHRNTVMNRINKIVELTGIDFSDGGLCQRLMFSCQLIQYYEHVLNLPLKLGAPTDNST